MIIGHNVTERRDVGNKKSRPIVAGSAIRDGSGTLSTTATVPHIVKDQTINLATENPIEINVDPTEKLDRRS
jgi:hypothetical protein